MASDKPVKDEVVHPARRLPKERMITWSIIGLMLVLVLIEWQSRNAYLRTLASLDGLLPADQARTITAAEVDRVISGWAFKRTVTERGQAFMTLRWPSLFRTYKIWLTVDRGGLITALHNSGAMPDVDDVLPPNASTVSDVVAPSNLVNPPAQTPDADANTALSPRLDGKKFADGIPFDDPTWAKQNPRPEDFLGQWSGQWDFIWTVQFTIRQEPGSDRFAILYEWQERIGEPLRQGHTVATLSGNVFKIGRSIEMTLSAQEPNRAKAFGSYALPRATDLVRVPLKSDSPN